MKQVMIMKARQMGSSLMKFSDDYYWNEIMCLFLNNLIECMPIELHIIEV